MPAATSVTPAIGDRIRTALQASDAPVGTVVTEDDETYEKISENQWRGSDGDYYPDNTIGGWGMVVSNTPESGETLRQFQRRFKQAVDLAQQRNGVNRTPIENAFAELGIAELDGLSVGDTWNGNPGLPVGSLIQVGTEDDWSSYGLFQMDRYETVQHLSGGNQTWRNGRIVRIGGDVYDPPSEIEDSTDPLVINAWKIKAYKVSRKVKQETAWCPVLESTMRSVGITDRLLAADDTQYVTADEARALPEGTVLRWVSETRADCFMWFVREDGLRNISQTRRILGQRPDGRSMRHSMGRMQVLWRPDSGRPMCIRFHRDDLWELLPAETQFVLEPITTDTHGGYVIHENRHATSANGNGDYTRDNFGPDLYVVALP